MIKTGSKIIKLKGWQWFTCIWSILGRFVSTVWLAARIISIWRVYRLPLSATNSGIGSERVEAAGYSRTRVHFRMVVAARRRRGLDLSAPHASPVFISKVLMRKLLFGDHRWRRDWRRGHVVGSRWRQLTGSSGFVWRHVLRRRRR